MRTYTINANDTETRQAWMASPAVVSYRAVAQDSGRCRFEVVTADTHTLESVLDADDDVIDYEQTGDDVIDYAERHGLRLNKYADPIEDAREGLTVAEAREIAREDPGLIYLDVDAPTR